MTFLKVVRKLLLALDIFRIDETGQFICLEYHGNAYRLVQSPNCFKPLSV